MMAVQAQYPYPWSDFRARNNIVFQDFQDSVNLNDQLIAGGQPITNGAAVLSKAENELTCNIVSGSRERNRGNQMPLNHQLPLMLSQHYSSHQFPIPNLPKDPAVDKSTTTTSSIGLHQSYVDNRLYGSGGASTSGTLSSDSSFSPDLNSYVRHQNMETDSLILLHNEKLRSMLGEARRRHCRSMLCVVEKAVVKRLEEKEAELANASRRSAQLQEQITQMCAENQIWVNVAKNNEAVVSSLKSSLEQIMFQNQTQTREGFGDSDEIAVLDGRTANVDGEEATTAAIERTIQENRELRQRRCCKVCSENEVSVLLLPCRHLCLCKSCESKLNSCPICNSVKNATLQIFMS